MAIRKKPKAKPPRSREVVEKAIATATLSLGRMDRRLARLSTIKGRLEAAANQTERRRAINNESINEWIAEFREDSEGTSDGIDFESLGVDLLILDEAQNMKNLWPVERREGVGHEGAVALDQARRHVGEEHVGAHTSHVDVAAGPSIQWRRRRRDGRHVDILRAS